jgi:hypothetical protein
MRLLNLEGGSVRISQPSVPGLDMPTISHHTPSLMTQPVQFYNGTYALRGSLRQPRWEIPFRDVRYDRALP